jgi:hypothetical protein
MFASLGHLRNQSAAAVDRAARQTLDLTGHRFDAWLTSLASRRLAGLRRSSSGGGLVVGGYGWLEGGLTPRPPFTPVDATPPGERSGLVYDPSNAGHLQAPSVAQAVTAAVLRSGQLTHADPDNATAPNPFAVDLSSRRVRLANFLLDALREGQPLGIVLGYRFERALYDRGPAGFVAAFRSAVERGGPTPPPARAPVDVVDGVKLLRLNATAGGIQWGSGGLPLQTDSEVQAALALLQDDIDAVADALVAESVHQTLQGNYARAGAALAAAGVEEVHPPELEFVNTPRTGSSVTHRRLRFLDEPEPASPWVRDARDLAEPAVAAWIAAALPPPAKVRADFVLRDRHLGEAFAGVFTRRLSDLGPSPAEILAAAASRADLERRLALHELDPARRPAGAAVDALAQLLPEPATPLGAGDVYLTDALELARVAADLLAGARPLDARDLGMPGQVAAAGINPAADLLPRANDARSALSQVASGLTDALAAGSAAAMRAALTTAARFGIPGAWPLSAAPRVGEPEIPEMVDELRRQAGAVLGEADRRKAAADQIAGRASLTVTDYGELFLVLFGESFRLIPRFTLADATLAGRAFSAVVSGPVTGDQEPLAWFARMARVRSAAGTVETMAGYEEALGTGTGLALSIGQLPVPAAGATQRWVGLPVDGPPRTTRIPANTLSLVAVGRPPTTSGTVAGLLLDEWVETVPGARETAALTFHYDAPGSTAPHAILIAVAPRLDQPRWSLDDLAATLLETLDLAKVRPVDPADIAAGHLLVPPLHLPNKVAATENVPIVRVDRLTDPPAGYGEERTAQGALISGLTPGTVEQGRTTRVTAAGERLLGSWQIAGPGLSLAVAGTPAATENSVALDITAELDARLGAATVSVLRIPGGTASLGVQVTPRPQVSAVSPSLLHQAQASTTTNITLDGYNLAETTGAAVSGLSGVTAALGPVSANRVTVTVTVPGSPQPPVDWDPNEPGGPNKPEPPIEFRYDVPLTLTLTLRRTIGGATAESTLPVALTLDALDWR